MDTARKNYTVRLSEAEARRLDAEAEKQGRTRANLIRLAIVSYLNGAGGQGVSA